MTPIKRRDGDQHLHRKSKDYRNAVIRKMRAYHAHIQLGVIAQGMRQYLSMLACHKVWGSFGSWLRTIRPDILPSEQVIRSALRNSLPKFLAGGGEGAVLAKFIAEWSAWSEQTPTMSAASQ